MIRSHETVITNRQLSRDLQYLNTCDLLLSDEKRDTNRRNDNNTNYSSFETSNVLEIQGVIGLGKDIRVRCREA